MTISAAVEINDYMFDTAIELGYYSRGGVHADTKKTNLFPSEYGFLGKVIKYKFTVSEDQDVVIHHFGSGMENGSKIYLYKLLEPRVEYEYFEDGQIVPIGMANEWMFAINNQEYDRNNSYYQTNYQTARDRYMQYCNERGLQDPNIKNFQPFLFVEGLRKGTYYIISEGYARKYNSGYIYMEDGILSTTVMYGSRSNTEAVKEETDIGKYSASFSYTDISRPSDYKEGAALHKFEITAPMDITILHDISPKHTSIALLDVNNKEIATSANSPSSDVVYEGGGQTTLYKQQLPPGIYHIISASDDVDEYIHISVRGYAAKIGNKEEPLSLTSVKNYIYTIIPTVSLSHVSNITLDQSIQKIVYYDGLGRLEQTISRGASPSKQDLVSYKEYDSYGRESIIWNPVPIGGSGNAYDREDIAFQSSNVYEDAYSKSTRIYELSPLDRISEEYGAGKAWHKNERRIKTSYMTNVSGVDTLNVIYYTVADVRDSGMRIKNTSSYATAQLSATRVEDEDGSVLLEFKNKLGQLVLTRQVQYSETGKELYDTYYVYDNFGNLRVVIPPEAAGGLLSNSSGWTDADINVDNYCFLYKYDYRNRCVAKKMPGCDWVYFIYDKADRLIFSQDGEQRVNGEWTFSIPDALGRIVLSGKCNNSLDYTANPLAANVVETNRSDITNIYKGYAPPTGISLVTPEVLSVNYYDDYTFLGNNGIPNISETQYSVVSDYGICYGDHQLVNKCKNKGLLTGVLTAQITPSGTSTIYLYSVMYYDFYGRLIQTKSNNHLTNGKNEEYTAYNFIGQPVKKKHVHSASGKSTQTEIYSYTYDHADRLLTIIHQLNNGTPVTLVSNSYDELGRLISNSRNGNPNLKTEYTYNVRSWVKSIVGPLFNESLYYNDSRSNGTNVSCYNGNISGIDWKVGNGKDRGYNFSYDNLSRLIDAAYLEGNVMSDKFSTSYGYDKHGNMLSLSRHGNVGTTSYGVVDDLILSYEGNQLVSVEDKGTNPSLSMSMDFKDGSHELLEYGYDANGNMVKDLNKGISNIEYNFLNLPRRIIFSGVNNPVNEYVYSASGEKLSVIHKSSTEKRTDYVGNMIYENGSLKRILVDGGYIENGTYHFYFQDHLGNNRVVAKSDGTVVQRTHYYPYGMSFAEGAFEAKQPYKYNGKELDTENGLNLSDYGARQMEATLGRFTSIDPKAESYPWNSPYMYAGDNPILNFDPDGEDYWGTNDQELIKQFLNSVGRGAKYYDFTGWDHATDAQFTSNLTYNDETGKYHMSYATVVNGEMTVIGKSFDANLKPVSLTGRGYPGAFVYDYAGGHGALYKSAYNAAQYMELSSFATTLMSPFDPNSYHDGVSNWNVDGTGRLVGVSNVQLAKKGGGGKALAKIFIKGFGNVNKELFHNVIKPNIISAAGGKDYLNGIVGRNPNITIANGKIVLQGVKDGPFGGKIHNTGLNANDFFN